MRPASAVTTTVKATYRLVEDDRVESRNASRRGGAKHAQAADREREASGPAERGEEQTLDERLSDEPPPAGAHGDANREFRLARGGARQHEVRDIDAGDEQHEAHRAEQHEQRALRGRPRRSSTSE